MTDSLRVKKSAQDTLQINLEAKVKELESEVSESKKKVQEIGVEMEVKVKRIVESKNEVAQDLVESRKLVDEKTIKAKQQAYLVSDLRKQLEHWEEKELSLEHDKRTLRTENEEYASRVKDLAARVQRDDLEIKRLMK